MQLLLEWTCGGNHCKKWNCFQNCRVDEGEQMWGGWHSMERFLKDQFTSAEEEMTQLETEDGKAQLGGWQNTTTGLTRDQSSLATSLTTRATPRDLLAWRLRTSAVQFMQGRDVKVLMVLRCFSTVVYMRAVHSSGELQMDNGVMP
jgi:hypothetical protein